MGKRQISRNFSYRLIGNRLMKKFVVETLQIFPDEIIDKVSKNCWFISSYDESWGFVLRGKEIKNSEYVVFLSEELFAESEAQIEYTIAHEIGHVLLGHRNSIGKVQTKKEIKKQEKEAHKFAIKYLNSLTR